MCMCAHVCVGGEGLWFLIASVQVCSVETMDVRLDCDVPEFNSGDR